MNLRILAPMALATLLATCATARPLPDPQQQASNLPAIPDNIRLAFHPAPPQQGKAVLTVSGFGGVNHFRGEALTDPGEQRPLASTRKRGTAARMQFESAFLQQMEQVV